QVSSVSVWYKCLASEDIKVHCSAEGDDLTYSWTSNFNTLSQLENGTSTLTLNKGQHGNVTCYVKNHVSQSYNTTELQPCPEPTTMPTISVSTSSNFTSFGTVSSVVNKTINPTTQYTFPEFLQCCRDTKLSIGFKKVNILTHDVIEQVVCLFLI
ncbi:hypothetical protein C0J50_12123, partial [Silurus asotus]